MNEHKVISSIEYDELGSMRVVTAPGYELVGKWLKSDLWGIEYGPYREVRDAAVRGIEEGATDEISGNGFSVEVDGHTTTITLMSRPEYDLCLTTEDLLATLDAYATSVELLRDKVRTEDPQRH